MKFPSKEIVENVRAKYPPGTRVELVKMEDDQAPPAGTRGTVIGVDDTASVMVKWDNGSGLNVVYGEDYCREVHCELSVNETKEVMHEWASCYAQVYCFTLEDITARDAIESALDKQEEYTPEAYQQYAGKCKCGAVFLDKATNYCGNCGQKLNWRVKK